MRRNVTLTGLRWEGLVKVGLEVMSIDSVTSGDGHDPGERAPTRRSARRDGRGAATCNVRRS
jgi:hypothetical protein